MEELRSVNFEFEDGTRMKVFVDLDKEEVTRIWSQ